MKTTRYYADIPDDAECGEIDSYCHCCGEQNDGAMICAGLDWCLNCGDSLYH